jgi:hypothetical protein
MLHYCVVKRQAGAAGEVVRLGQLLSAGSMAARNPNPAGVGTWHRQRANPTLATLMRPSDPVRYFSLRNSSLPSLRGLPRKMRPLAYFITCLTRDAICRALR